MGKTSVATGFSKPDVCTSRHQKTVHPRKEQSWNRRARVGSKSALSARVACHTSIHRGSFVGAYSGRSRRRHYGDSPTHRRPMELITSLYALLAGGGFSPKIDSIAFSLHCGATTIALLAASAVLTTRQLVGNPIDCIHTRDIPEDVLNTYCWIHSTFTVSGSGSSSAEAYKGVMSSNAGQTRKYGKYYQWVAFMLFFQIESCNSNFEHFPLSYLVEIFRVAYNSMTMHLFIKCIVKSAIFGK